MSDESEVSDREEEAGFLVTTKNTALLPIRYATSKPARQVYLRALLFVLAGAALAGIASVAYVVFYYNYVPIRGFSQPVYLQFESGQNPFATLALKQGIVSDQPYDVRIVLLMPRTPTNRAAGNFMIDLQLFGQSSARGEKAVIVRERRPSIMTYHSTTMEQLLKLSGLPLYLMGWRKESEILDVSMMEGVRFSRGWSNIPSTARVELSGGSKLQVYSAELIFKARLRGLRYVMYNYRISSFIVLSTMFWAVEMSFVAAIWLALSFLLQAEGKAVTESGKDPLEQRIKREDMVSAEDASDPQTLQTLQTKVKKEEVEPSIPLDPYPLAGEADDEDEDHGIVVGRDRIAHSDSGIGTSMESSSGKSNPIRRRSSKTFGGSAQGTL